MSVKPQKNRDGIGAFLASASYTIQGLQVEMADPSKLSRTQIYVKCGATQEKGRTGNKREGGLLRWNIEFPLRESQSSSTIVFEVKRRKHIWSFRRRVIGTAGVEAGKVIAHIQSGKDNLNIPLDGIFSSNGNAAILMLDLTTSLSEEELKKIAQRSDVSLVDSSTPSANKDVGNVVSRGEMPPLTAHDLEHLDSSSDVIEHIRPVIKIFDRLAKIHPIAETAWIVISCAFKVVEVQYERDKQLVRLFKTMMETYQTATREDVLAEADRFPELFESMIKQSIECSIFISAYRSQNYLRRLVDFDGSQQIKKFTESLEDFDKRFQKMLLEVAATSALTSNLILAGLKTQIEYASNEKRLEPLKPKRILSPKSQCVRGTRTQSKQVIMDWIFNRDETLLWIRGVAGCGKSSLMGTVNNMMLEMGISSRRAAFVRFDRSDYRDAGEFVKALAYALAKYDPRIENAVITALEKHKDITQHTDLSVQLEHLVIEPLLQVPDMQKEGPVVVLVDGLDECSRDMDTNYRRQLISLFLSDSFKKIPFLKIIVSSRPDEDINAFFRYHETFQSWSHIYLFLLDTTSEETVADISHFIRTKFQEIKNARFQQQVAEEDAVVKLAERASGLFIWAAIAVDLITDSPLTYLKTLLDTGSPKDAEDALDKLYTTALNEASQNRDIIRKHLQIVLGAIMVVNAHPPTYMRNVNVLHMILEQHWPDAAERVDDVRSVLNKLSSVLVFETDSNSSLSLIHKSFDDFLTTKARSDRWCIDIRLSHEKMALAHISCITSYVKRDMLQEESLTWLAYRYSSCIWADELFAALSDANQESPRLISRARSMFEKFLLRWICTVYVWNIGPGITFPRRLAYSSDFASMYSDGLQFFLRTQREAGYSRCSSLFKYLCAHHPENSMSKYYLPVFAHVAGSNSYHEIVANLKKSRLTLPPILDGITPASGTIIEGIAPAEDIMSDTNAELFGWTVE